MSCKELDNDLLAYLDKRLDAANTARVETHLNGCAECRKEAQSMRETWRLLGYYPGRTVSAQLPARLLEAARLQLAIERRWTHRLFRHAPLIASAAVILLVFGITVIFRGQETPRGPDADYQKVLSSIDNEEEREVVQNLDLYENLSTVENMDVLEDDQTVEYLDLVASLSDEDF